LLEPLQQFFDQDREYHRDACIEALETVGLGRDILERFPDQLSSGQRQRVGIARALLARPELIIADEAVSALDVSVQAQILELISGLSRDRNIAFLFISHDLAVVSQIANQVGIMFKGRIVESATGDSIFRNPAHPYTRELLQAIPSPDPGIRMAPADTRAGLARNEKSPGCVFASRCPQVMDICLEKQPSMQALESTPLHHVECYLYQGESAGEFSGLSESEE
jgi:oligopeptide/dipeptide ABC transporter ATP-binding protein